jgi:hypothetical protein
MGGLGAEGEGASPDVRGLSPPGQVSQDPLGKGHEQAYTSRDAATDGDPS